MSMSLVIEIFLLAVTASDNLYISTVEHILWRASMLLVDHGSWCTRDEDGSGHQLVSCAGGSDEA